MLVKFSEISTTKALTKLTKAPFVSKVSSLLVGIEKKLSAYMGISSYIYNSISP